MANQASERERERHTLPDTLCAVWMCVCAYAYRVF